MSSRKHKTNCRKIPRPTKLTKMFVVSVCEEVLSKVKDKLLHLVPPTTKNETQWLIDPVVAYFPPGDTASVWTAGSYEWIPEHGRALWQFQASVQVTRLLGWWTYDSVDPVVLEILVVERDTHTDFIISPGGRISFSLLGVWSKATAFTVEKYWETFPGVLFYFHFHQEKEDDSRTCKQWFQVVERVDYSWCKMPWAPLRNKGLNTSLAAGCDVRGQ